MKGKNKYIYTPLKEPAPITEHVWPEGTLPLVHTRTMTYMHKDYIRDCIEGILMQKTTFPVQVLIHEDASTDKTVEIVKEYEQKYPRLIKAYYQKENSYTKPDKIERLAEFNSWRIGKYEAICEGDDYWTDPLKLQKQVDFLEKNPEYSMCFHFADVLYLTQQKDDLNLYKDLEEREYTANEIIKKWTIPTASVLFRTKFINNIKQDPRFVFGDIVLFLSMTQCGKIYCLGDKMSVYRRHDSGILLSAYNEVSINVTIKLIKHYEAIKEHFFNIDEKIIINSLEYRYVSLFFKSLRKLNFKGLFVSFRYMIMNPVLSFSNMLLFINRYLKKRKI